MKLLTASVLLSLFLADTDLQAQTQTRCAGSGEIQNISFTDWETGLDSWTVGTYAVFRPETFDTPDWAIVDTLPDGRPGSGAFVPNLEAGDCVADNEAGVLTLTSPVIQIPSDVEAPRISFHHWFHIEYGWDGGNLKISVNGGPYTLVPGTAFEMGPYTDVLFDAFDEFGVIFNNNPLAEQEAFTGPEGEGVTGNWAESRVNLLGIAGPGDSIQLRFDFGIDSCFGETGWYVDEVEIYSCSDEPPPSGSSLTLVNRVTNNNGGTAEESDWTLSATGPFSFSGRGPSVTSSEAFEAGTYDLSLSGPDGYITGAWDCSGGAQEDSDTVTVAVGETVTCTVTIDDAAPSLTLVKQVVNDDGGTAEPSDWTLRADGPSPFSGRGPQVFNGANFQAGTYELSESGGPFGYSASDWVCDTGVQINGDTIQLDLGDAVTCTVTNDDFLLDSAINAGHSGAWFNPETSGQGFLVDVAPSEQFMFVAWFTFTDAESASPSEQHWYTAQGFYAGDRADLTLYETLGGRFDDPQGVTTTAIGELALEFSGCAQGLASYRIDTEQLQGEIPIFRAIPGSENTCNDLAGIAAEAVDINPGMDGAWFDPNTAGQGFLVDAYPDPEGSNFIFVAWFTYGDDTESGQRWLTAQGGFEGSAAEIDVYETTGGSFDAPDSVETVKVGTMVLDFTDCSNAQLTYVLDDQGVAGDIAITRAVPGAQALCEELAAVE